MNKRNLALWPMFLPKSKPKPKQELRVERLEWNHEQERHELGYREPQESVQERLQRLAPPYGDLKKLVF